MDEEKSTNQDVAEGPSQRFETIVAILIALVTVIGAVIAWRSSVADDGAGDADLAGIRASLNVEETRALNFVNSYENYGSFLTYKRYSDLGDMIAEDQTQLPEDQAAVMEVERADAHDLSVANNSLFPNKFLNRDGTYALQRQMGELWADAAKEKDLNPDSQFSDADKSRQKSNYLLLDVTLLALALVLFTLVESVGDRAKYLLVGLGSLSAVIGVVMAFLIEFRM